MKGWTFNFPIPRSLPFGCSSVPCNPAYDIPSSRWVCLFLWFENISLFSQGLISWSNCTAASRSTRRRSRATWQRLATSWWSPHCHHIDRCYNPLFCGCWNKMIIQLGTNQLPRLSRVLTLFAPRCSISMSSSSWLCRCALVSCSTRLWYQSARSATSSVSSLPSMDPIPVS